MLFAYFTPEVALPVASVVAAAFGFILMVGRVPLRIAAKGFRRLAQGGRRLAAKLGL